MPLRPDWNKVPAPANRCAREPAGSLSVVPADGAYCIPPKTAWAIFLPSTGRRKATPPIADSNGNRGGKSSRRGQLGLLDSQSATLRCGGHSRMSGISIRSLSRSVHRRRLRRYRLEPARCTRSHSPHDDLRSRRTRWPDHRHGSMRGHRSDRSHPRHGSSTGMAWSKHSAATAASRRGQHPRRRMPSHHLGHNGTPQASDPLLRTSRLCSLGQNLRFLRYAPPRIREAAASGSRAHVEHPALTSRPPLTIV